jgi:colicin import membrane protein
MAVVRARSAPPYAAFAGFFLFGVAAVAAVAFYVMWAKNADDLDKAQKSMTTAMTDRDQAKKTAAAQKTAAQDAEDRAKAAKAEADQAKADKDQEVAEAHRLQAEAKARADEFSAQSKAFEQSISDINAQIDKLNQAIADAEKQRNKAVADSQDQLKQLADESEQAQKDRVLQIEDLTGKVADLQAKNDILQQRLRGGAQKADVSIGEPDGHVVFANQTSKEVYINLGKKDHIVPGMTFTAYDPRIGVRFGTDELAQGNGSMEVIEVTNDSALCRISRVSPQHTIQSGDLISNLVYHADKSRKYHFAVFGNFDLDGDGKNTPAERDRLIRLITSWGGVVEDKVTSQTDYVVQGSRPKAISITVDDTPSDTPAAGDAAATAPATPDEPEGIAARRKKEIDAYEDAEKQARSLGIPVLNQNRFLAMVGYYGTTIVKH